MKQLQQDIRIILKCANTETFEERKKAAEYICGKKYSEFLDEYRIKGLIRKYSDYIRHPIRMLMEDYRMKKNAAGLKKYYQDYTELVTSQPEAGRRMLEEKRKFIEGYMLTTKTRTAINRVKKAMLNGRIEADAGMQEIRRLRREYFERMDEME
mgnify:CR=1 FL=1